MSDQLPANIPQPPMKSLFDHEGKYFSPGMLFVLFLIVLSWVGFFDSTAVEFIDSSLIQSFAAFATAKGLNAVIGVLESSDITIKVATFEIGKLLAPAKELIDQFAEVMEYAIGSLMLQKLLITISSSTFFKVLLTITGGVFLLFKVFRYKFSECYEYYPVVYKVFVTVLFARFFFIAVFGVSTAIDSAFIADTTGEKIAMIENTPGEVDPTEQINAEEQEERRQLSLQLKEVSGLLREEQSRLLEVDSNLEQQTNDIESFENQIAELDSQLTIKDKVWGTDDKYKQELLNQREGLKVQLEGAEDSLEQLTDKREQQKEKVDDLSEQVDDLQSAIDNYGKGILATMQALGSNFIKSVQHKLNTAADTALELTVIFIFKSILMPVLFLFAGYKLFIKVWNYDVRDLRRNDWREAMGGEAKPVNPALPSN